MIDAIQGAFTPLDIGTRPPAHYDRDSDGGVPRAHESRAVHDAPVDQRVADDDPSGSETSFDGAPDRQADLAQAFRPSPARHSGEADHLVDFLA